WRVDLGPDYGGRGWHVGRGLGGGVLPGDRRAASEHLALHSARPRLWSARRVRAVGVATPHAAGPREQEAPCPAWSSRRALARLHRTTHLCRRGGWSCGLRKGDGSDGPGAVRYSCGWPGLTAPAKDSLPPAPYALANEGTPFPARHGHYTITLR